MKRMMSKTSVSKVRKMVILSILNITILSVSCGDDVEESLSMNLPDELVRTYTGRLLYTTAEDEIIKSDEGTAKLVATGNSQYRIEFSDNVPSLSGISFETRIEDDYYSNSGASIIDNSLSIGYNKGFDNWVFNGDK